MIKNIIIIVLGYFVWLAYFEVAHSTIQENQYCDIKTKLNRLDDEYIIIIDKKNQKIIKYDYSLKSPITFF